MIRFPRIIGFLLDLIHRWAWGYYVRSIISQSPLETLDYGSCRFYLEKENRLLLEASLSALEERDSESALCLKSSQQLSFILEGDFVNYHREANLKVSVQRNAIKHDGIEGIIAAIGYGLVIQREHDLRGFLRFHLFPPTDDQIKTQWIAWMKSNVTNNELIGFYEAAPMQ